MPSQGNERAKARARAYKKAHRDELLPKYRAYNKAHKAKKDAQAHAKWVAMTPKERKAKRRAQYMKHQEKERETAREYQRQRRSTNPVVLTEAQQERRRELARIRYHKQRENGPVNTPASQMAKRAYKARIKASPVNDLTHAQWISIQQSFNHCCAYCGEEHKGRLTMDHITPLTKGGAHTMHNIVPACARCNSKKRTRKPLKPVQPLLL